MDELKPRQCLLAEDAQTCCPARTAERTAQILGGLGWADEKLDRIADAIRTGGADMRSAGGPEPDAGTSRNARRLQDLSSRRISTLLASSGTSWSRMAGCGTAPWDAPEGVRLADCGPRGRPEHVRSCFRAGPTARTTFDRRRWTARRCWCSQGRTGVQRAGRWARFQRVTRLERGNGTP